MEVCYWALLFMPLVILHHLLNVFVQLANKREFKQKKNSTELRPPVAQLLNNLPTFYGTRRFIVAFTKALHWSITSARSILSILSKIYFNIIFLPVFRSS
jgi:hypothetical protein